MFLAPLRTGHSWRRSLAGDGKLNGREAATSDVRYGGFQKWGYPNSWMVYVCLFHGISNTNG
jgi:hypothetical protein